MTTRGSITTSTPRVAALAAPPLCPPMGVEAPHAQARDSARHMMYS
eukprot:CAMPEP_0113663698 /NCGR_PEP_ID=MMETSP0038_2-20120614/1305_1 /TAXON_ID=2898 /ORGANISM="Cryptomonas paramecium" /LENGTH=45 /DNA_ID=CAMNT_0000578791 /DNA_START=30 /DNA_END=165 /DNA_ORIENTATION=- /assembly_acc=CAM_ASM_000170